MKVCTKCGVDLLNEDIYCPNCGTKVPPEVKPTPAAEVKKSEPVAVDQSGTPFFDRKFKGGINLSVMIGVFALAFASVFVSIGCLNFPPIGPLIVIAFIIYLFGIVWSLIAFFKRYKKEEKPLNKWLPMIIAGLCLVMAIMCLFL